MLRTIALTLAFTAAAQLLDAESPRAAEAQQALERLRIAGIPDAIRVLPLPHQVVRGRQVGIHGHVAKFDRPGLIAALKERTAMTQVA